MDNAARMQVRHARCDFEGSRHNHCQVGRATCRHAKPATNHSILPGRRHNPFMTGPQMALPECTALKI